MCKQQAKRPAFNKNELKEIITALRLFEKTGRKQRTREIRALMRDYVHFLIYTGCRPGTEVKNLRYDDIERFSRDGVDYLGITVDGKTGERTLVAPIKLEKYLNRLKRRNTSNSRYVFRLSDGSYPKDLHGCFLILLRQLDLTHDKRDKRYSLYSLRHSYATEKLLSGVPMHLVARQLGNSTIMLEKFYSKVQPHMAAHLFV